SNYIESLEFLFKSKSKTKYDLIIHDIVNTRELSKYFENLDSYLSKSHIERYINSLTEKTYLINGKTVALPIYLENSMLYSNKALLDEYNCSIPETWDELLNTTYYILNEVKKKDNEITGFAIDLTDSEGGFASYYEYIYSFREKVENPFPGIRDTEVEIAMETLKKIKDKLDDGGMQSNISGLMNCLNNSNCLFVKTWNNVEHNEDYVLSFLPGKKKGISGSCIGGYNIGMNKYISEDIKEKAATVIEYITSIEFQEDIVMNYGYQSASKDILDNESVCQNFKQCQNFKNSQLIMRPIDATEDYLQYSQKYRINLFNYLFENEDLKQCLQNIEYLTRIFYEERTSMSNKILTLIIGVTDLFMITTYCLSFTKRQRHKFRLLNGYYWFLYMFGLMLIMSFGFTGMGQLNNFKCRIRPFTLSVGYTLSNTLLLIRLIINFPQSGRSFVRFCEKHFLLSLVLSILIDITLNLLLFIDPYKVTVETDGVMLYNSCTLSSGMGHILLGFIFLYKILIGLAMIILVFVEWNIKEFKHDIRYITSTIFISVIAYILYAATNFIEIKGYKAQFIVPALVSYLYAISNYMLYFVARFFTKYSNNNDDTTIINIKNARYGAVSPKITNNTPISLEKHSSNTSINQCNGVVVVGPTQRRMSLMDHLVSLHNYGDEIKKTSDLNKHSNPSSMVNINVNVSGKKLSRSSLNNSSMNSSTDEVVISHRRLSQIGVIPENKIPKIISSSTEKISEDSFNEVSYPPRNRTRSVDNTNYTRNHRINSLSNNNGNNKKTLDTIKSCENLHSSRFSNNRIDSNVNVRSSTNLYPIKDNMPSQIISVYSDDNSQKMGSNNFLSINESVNMNHNSMETVSRISKKDKINASNNRLGIRHDKTFLSVNPSVFSAATTSFQSAKGDNESYMEDP
ncbi:periplasmic binding protein-like II, partial [Anaeromyces robustus]